MKKLLLPAVLFFMAANSFAQSSKYIAAMKSNIAAIDTSYRNPADLLILANNF